MLILKTLPILPAFFLLSACASHLQVFEKSGETSTELPGIPVAVPELFEITETTFYEKVVGAPSNFECRPEENSKYQYFPAGKIVYINFDPAHFGKSEFKIELTDTGVLKSASLNSDAAAAAKEIAGLLDAVVPYFEPKKEVETSSTRTDISAQEKFEKYCIKKGTKITSMTKKTF